MAGRNRGQAILSAILSLIVIIMILYVAFSGRMYSEMRFVKLGIDTEAAHFIAEGCIDEGIALVREKANMPDSPLFTFFRDSVTQPVRLAPVFSKRLAKECFPGITVEINLSLEKLDFSPIPDDLVENSLDRIGHIAFDANVKLGRGKTHIRLVKQFRLQDISTPEPFKKYGLVMEDIGFTQKSKGRKTLWRLSSKELNIMNNRWRYPMTLNGVSREMKGYPFVRQRLSYFFPTWQDMKEYLGEGPSLNIYGDVLSPDPLTLQLRTSRLSGIGRILSPNSNILLNRVDFAPGSALGFGVLSGGALLIEGLDESKPAPISIFLPSGKLCFRGKSKVHGFVLARDLESRKEAEKISQDLALSQPKTVVILSGQDLIWQANPVN